MPEIARFIAFGCCHCPTQDDEVIDTIVEKIAKFKPHYVLLLGDVHEADSASRWNSDYTFTVEDEWKAANELYGKIYKAYPQAKRVMLLGNHDDNFSQPGRIADKLKGGCDWRKYDHEPNLKYFDKIIDYRNDREHCFRIGQVSAGHGFLCGKNSDADEAVQMAVPYGCHIRVHTHRPVGITQVEWSSAQDLPYWFGNAGCTCNLRPRYADRRNTSKWGNGYIWGESLILKSPRYSVNWSAQTEILKMRERISFD